MKTYNLMLLSFLDELYPKLDLRNIEQILIDDKKG